MGHPAAYLLFCLSSSCLRRSSSVAPVADAQVQSGVTLMLGGHAIVHRLGFSEGSGVHLHGFPSQKHSHRRGSWA